MRRGDACGDQDREEARCEGDVLPRREVATPRVLCPVVPEAARLPQDQEEVIFTNPD